MAGKKAQDVVLLRWTKATSAEDTQDPLGLTLRVGARLADQLLHCITSITPRARYFAFFPWCVAEQDAHHDGSVARNEQYEDFRVRETALVLGAVWHHGGRTCDGGGLTGSEAAQKMYVEESASLDHVDLARRRLVKNPALDAYSQSMVNLGLFEEDTPSDRSAPGDQVEERQPYRLTDLGREVAESYGASLGRLAALKSMASRPPTSEISHLQSFGRRGCLCAITGQRARDRDLLRDLFFAVPHEAKKAHGYRRRSLLYLLQLAKDLSRGGGGLSHDAFVRSSYYGMKVAARTTRHRVPRPMRGIRRRWRMYYFHFYMSIALEGLFVCLLSRLRDAGLRGMTVPQAAEAMCTKAVGRKLRRLLELDSDPGMPAGSPRSLLDALGVPAEPVGRSGSRAFDEAVPFGSPVSEASLARHIRNAEVAQAPVGGACSLLMLIVTLLRFQPYADSPRGLWLGQAAQNRFVDLSPPTLLASLNRWRPNWLDGTWPELAEFVLMHFVIQQHQSMAYEKGGSEKSLIIDDGGTLISTGGYDRVGVGNARFRSATQILQDLGLIELNDAEELVPTAEGRSFLRESLAAEPAE